MNEKSQASFIVRVPTPIWLIVLVAAVLLADWLVTIPVLFRYAPVGIALVIIGIAIAASGRLTFKFQGAEIFPWSEKHSKLIVSGPFRFTRNPMYVGLVTIGLGAALWHGTWLMWLVPIVLFTFDNFIIIPYEEKSMEGAYGDDYRAYKTRVRRWI